jgi:hypothetical protein
MPVIQYQFAQTLGVDTQNVTVGFYFFDRASYESERYSQATIDAAIRESRRLGKILRA